MKKLITMFVIAMGLAAAATAQERPAFDEVDQNGDGSVDRVEASTVEGLDFDAADTNQDGSLSRTEYEEQS